MASNNDLADNQAVEELGSGSLSPDSELEVPVAPVPIPSPKPTDAEPSTARPKMVAGFIADDSDDEEGIVTEAASMPVPTTVKEEPTAPPPVQAVPAVTVTLTPAVVPQPSTQNTSVPKARLPHDRTGLLEDRIKEDPRGDMDAWLSLISEHRNRNKLDDARDVYERFFKVFPQAAEIWVQYTEMELENDNFSAAEQIFGKSLLAVPNVQLWSVYLNYIRRVNDLTNDRTGNARTTVSQAYDFVLANIGIDRDSGKIWQEYIQFIHSAPGQIGGSNPSWQDQQKMDQLRKAYQRAICVPMSSVNGLWKEYDQFEMSLNKMTGRKFLQERSPAYMTARSANTALENITRDLVRTTLPRLPPALGFEGDAEFIDQVVMWQKWIDWEQEDPLVLKADELDVYKQRVLYVYKQAVMALRFWPEMWVSAAEWCFSNAMDKEGDTFLNDGISANPESCLLAFKKADRLETTLSIEEADKGPAEKGAIVRAPFDKLLDSLYELIKKLKAREARDITKAEESSKLDASINAIIARADDDDDDNDAAAKESEAAKTKQIAAIKQGYTIQTQLLSRTISFAWIALMRAMRRIQGKGAVKDPIGGSRQIFSDARARGKITSDVYVASALIEHHVYKDAAGTKIFERGAKLFPEDEQFILEYLKHLLSIGDTTNARVAFETAVSRLTAKPENVSKARPLYLYFHKYESQYGELSQIRKLEKRMAELFPNDPSLQRFALRYKEGFDPTAVRPIVSPATQMKPKVIQSIEKPASVRGDSPMPQYQENSPRPQYLNPVTNSPKRPFPGDDFDNPPRKVARGESPLKGAAGRRLDQQKRMQQTQGTPQWQSNGPPPFVIPRDITFLLSIIPRADLYTATKFNAESMVRLLSQTPVPDYGTWKAAREQPVRYDGMLKSKPTHGEAPALPPVVRDAQAVHYGSAADGRRFEDPYLRRSRSPSATPVHGDNSRGSSGHHRNDSGGPLRGRQVLESGTSYGGNQFQDFNSLPTAHQRQDRDASRQWEYHLGGFTVGQQRPDSGSSQQWHWQGYTTGDM